MSLMATLTTAVSGLAVAQHAMSVTADNVANVNTKGYARKIAHQEAVIVDGRGAGARAADTLRTVDELLAGKLRDQHGKLARTEVIADLSTAIQDRLFGAPGDVNRGLPNHITRLASAAEALAAGPEQAAARVAFTGAAADLAREIGTAAGEIDTLRRDADQEIARTLDAINADVRALHDLNGELARSQRTAGLLDRRDQLLASLAEKIEISVHRHDNDTVAVYTRGGQALLEYAPAHLDYRAAATMSPATVFGPVRLFHAEDIDPSTGFPREGATGVVLVTGGLRARLTPELAADATSDAAQAIVTPFSSGRLQGLLEARDRVLPELADQIGELGELVRHALNAAHNGGTAQPPPSSLTGTRTDLGSFAAAARSGTAYLAVIDRATGDTLWTVAIDMAAASPAGLAAAVDAGLGGHGTATIGADGALAIDVGPGRGIALAEGDSAITVTDEAGRSRRFGFSHYFGLNDLVIPAGAQPSRLAVRPDILSDAGRLATARLDVAAGPPPAGTLGGVADNRGAQALAAAFETKHGTAARGAMPAGTHRIADYAAEIVALAAVQADQAKNAADNHRALAEDLDSRHAAVTGVNLDEELSRLVLYQQAYGVAARLVSITNELFDDLLAIAR